MTKEEFAEACTGVGVHCNPKSLRVYRNYGYSHQIAYAMQDFDGNIQRVVLLDSTSDLECYKALRTLIMIHGLPEARVSTDWGRQMG